LAWNTSVPKTAPQAPTIASQGLTSTSGSSSIRRGPAQFPREAVVHAVETALLRVA